MKSSSLYPFSDTLRGFREREHMSQQMLAQRLGIHRNTLGGWERGDYLPNTHADVMKIVEVLNLNEQDKEKLLYARYNALQSAEAATSTDPHWYLPYRRNAFFTGQAQVLERLHTVLTSNSMVALSQPQAISGLGGIGKTQIAIEYAYRFRQQYRAVLWVRAETVEEWMTDYVQISNCLNLSVKDDQDQNRIVEAVKQWLMKQNGWLLILDNLEDFHLADTFIPSLYQGAILATTRSSIPGSQFQSIVLEKMERSDAALLLLRRAHSMTSAHSLSQFAPADVQIAQEIVTAVDALPLALDQAGSYIQETQCGLEQYLQLYHSWQSDLLKRRGRSAPGHPIPAFKTLSLAIASVRQEHSTAVSFLQLCALTASEAIPIEVITHALAELLAFPPEQAQNPLLFDEMIEALRNYSLIHRDPGTNTVAIHRLVQAVLKDEMSSEQYQTWVRQLLQVIAQLLPEEVEYTTWTKWQRYVPHVLSCLDIAETLGQETREIAQIMDRVGFYLQERIQYEQAEKLLQRALRIYEKLGGPEDCQLATILLHLANLYHQNGRYAQAEPLYTRAKAIRLQQLGPEHTRTAQVINDLALLYLDQGKYAQAEPLFRQALAINRQVLPAIHADLASILGNLALLYYKQQMYEQAELLYREAMAIDQQVWGEQHPKLAINLNDLALIYTARSKYEQAEPLFQQARAIWERTLGLDHPYVAYVYHNMGKLYREQKRYEEAKEFFQRAITIREKQLDAAHPELATSLYCLASLYICQQQITSAEPLLKRAYEIRSQVLGADHQETIACHELYEQMLQVQEKTKKNVL